MKSGMLRAGTRAEDYRKKKYAWLPEEEMAGTDAVVWVGNDMLRDITIGQYYQTESLIHKMDPRVKLGGTLLYIISLFFFRNFVGICGRGVFSGACHPTVSCTVSIYGKGDEINPVFAADHCGL